MGKYQDLTGKTFGELTVIQKHGKDIKGNVLWICECSCKRRIIVRSRDLNSQNTKSCGCLKGINHGLSRTRIYKIYNGMKCRCYKCYSTEFNNYHSKGIKVCDEWLGKNGFINFYNWAITNGYNDNLTIDRIDNNGNYEPTNCRWITIQEQQNNKSTNRLITYNQETHNISQWVNITGIPRATIVKRLNNGWKPELALTKEVNKKFRNKKLSKNMDSKIKSIINGE